MLNWVDRYASAVGELSFHADGTLAESVLDVGCGPHGLSTAAPEARFVGIDLDFPGPVAPGMLALRNQPGVLPFADAAFDTVVCLDVLEHVPGPQRAAFVAELGRVAARRVLLACPSDEGAFIDALLADAFASRGMAIPGWLSEHDELGLPSAGEIAAACELGEGYRTREWPMPNGLLSILTVLADMLPEFSARAAEEFATQRQGWLELFGSARFGSSHRKGWVIERTAVRTAIVGADDPHAGVWAALACPACARLASLTPSVPAGAVICSACGHALAHESSGAFSLAAPPPPRRLAPVRTVAARRLLLSPDWERPETWVPAVARYAAAGRSGEWALCLDAVEPPLGITTVASMVARVCEAAAAGRPFDDIILLDEPYEPEGLAPVAGVVELAAAMALPARQLSNDPGQVLERALRAKGLLDEIRLMAERRRLELAPDPWADPEPLVTVRIATWKGHELLTRRTIPSVLAGSYPHVEVVVCSDGPDPAARAAVEAVGDPRVRYVELAQRPVYPAAPWSFWQVAGTYAVHHALAHSRGQFIAPLDHDDAFTQDHVAALLERGRQTGADLVYGQSMMETPDGGWWICGSAPIAHGHIVHGSVLYSSRLAHVHLDPHAWLLGEPGDWNMWRRIHELGARIEFLERVVTVHFGERSSIATAAEAATVEQLQQRSDEELVADLERTGIAWLAELDLQPVGVGA